MYPLMNNTKWEELRLAMYSLNKDSPAWRTKTLGTDHVSKWDHEWFYHFREGGYQDIEWVEIKITSFEQKEKVLSALQSIHLPGCETENGFKILGYAESNQATDYL